MKNALTHGNNDKSIEVCFQHNEEDEHGIDLVVNNYINDIADENNMKDTADEKEQGITQKALSYCLNNGKTLCEFKRDMDKYISKIHMFFVKG